MSTSTQHHASPIDPNQIEIEYKRCPHCQTNIALTSQNPDGKCPFRFCKGYGYSSMNAVDSTIDNKYAGKAHFSYHLGDSLKCISTVYDRSTHQINLVCLTLGYPGIFIISPEEFDKIQ